MDLERRRPRRDALTAAVCGVLLATAAACGGTSSAQEGGASAAEDDRTSVVAVGDSLTAGLVPLEELRSPGTGSWVGAAQGEPLEFRGGWAVPGATTADMLAGVEREDAEVVVVLAGTNDTGQGVPWEASAGNLRAIVDAVGVDEVLVSAIPPLDGRPTEALAYNTRLRALAQEQGWAFTDPWAGTRTPAGTFVPGASADGVHPTPEVADGVGRRIREALLAGAGA
jgi:lysophospholipase L1-like esterase